MPAQGVQVGARPDPGPHAHGLHLPVDQALVQLGQLRVDLGDPLRHGQDLGLQLLGLEGPVGEAEADGLESVEGVAGEHELHGRPHADDPGVVLVVGRAHRPHRRIADLRVLGDVDEVTCDGELRAPGQAPAVDLGDDGLGHVPHAEAALDDVPGPLALAAGRVERQGADPGEVVARREAGARAPQDDDPHRRILVRRLKGREQLPAQGVGEGVALLGPVQGQAPDVRRRIIDQEDGLVGHVVSPRGGLQPRRGGAPGTSAARLTQGPA